MLERILTGGVASLEDRMYIAFAGPPIPPYEIRCYCGQVVKVGHDEKGYYIEGAATVIFDPSERKHASERAGNNPHPSRKF